MAQYLEDYQPGMKEGNVKVKVTNIASLVTNGLIPIILPAVQQTLAAGGGAVNITSYFTEFATDAGGDALTLADGAVAGQLKKIQLTTDGGGNGVLTPSNLADGDTITFADVGDYALLMWNGTNWRVLELGNDADGTTAPVLA